MQLPHESEAALKSAVAALPCVTDGGAGANPSGVMSARLRSVCALADELTQEERAALLAHLQATATAQGTPDAAGDVVPLLENGGAQTTAQGTPDANAAAA